jgi:hypothetical protein
VDLDIAARKAAAVIAGRLLSGIQAASGRLTLKPRRAIVTGDDSLTLRALIANLYQNGIVCEVRGELDAEDGANLHLAMPGMARLIGMMRAAQGNALPQPFLDAYNATPTIRAAAPRRTPPAPAASAPRWNLSMMPRNTVAAKPRAARRPQLATALAQMLF